MVELRLDLEGMTCASCAARIEKKLNKLDGVEASVNYATEEAAVSFDSSVVAVDDLILAVEATGYTASLPSEIIEGADPSRSLRRRLVVAAVLTAPLVLLAMVSPLQFSGWEWVALAFAASVGGFPVVVKTIRGGYDGKGVWVVSTAEDLPDGVLLAEEKVAFRRELAALVARSPSGQVAACPVVESEQRDGICWEVTAPAPGLDADLVLLDDDLRVRRVMQRGSWL